MCFRSHIFPLFLLILINYTIGSVTNVNHDKKNVETAPKTTCHPQIPVASPTSTPLAAIIPRREPAALAAVSAIPLINSRKKGYRITSSCVIFE